MLLYGAGESKAKVMFASNGTKQYPGSLDIMEGEAGRYCLYGRTCNDPIMSDRESVWKKINIY